DLCAIASQTTTAHVFPDGDVPHQFPNAMRVSERPRVRLVCGDAGEHVTHRWSMPGVAFEGSLELIKDSLDFDHNSFSVLLIRQRRRRSQIRAQGNALGGRACAALGL